MCGANLSPFLFLDVNLDCGLSGPVPQLVVGDDFQPRDTEDVPKTLVGKCLKFVAVGLGYPPGL